MRPQDVHDRHHVHPDQWPDYRALTGDPADNIPGIRGVGPKTAADLLAGGIHLEHLRDSPRLERPRCRAITGQYQQLLVWRDLIRLNTAVPLPRNPVTGRPSTTMPRAATLLEELGLW
ncbi:5'-3' exonuclease H3TH domain-containing protein [Actinomadura meridiana]|uniref:5'-3' exonuclease H3TH domain-containing protein n=1 Tax=Actinomadura meridiana TaxID=559626 RepID=UPI0031EB8488